MKDITGKRFGRLIALNYLGNSKWHCKCDCGNDIVVFVGNLNENHPHTTSCGCYQKEQAQKAKTTHGMRGSRIYTLWSAMINRCYVTSDTNYHKYGGRGIRVCDEWRNSFQAFYTWSMLNGYDDDLSIDRIENDGDYEPGNCRWTTKLVQANNRRNVKLYTFQSKTQSLADWCRELELNRKTVYARINIYGWPLEKALTTK